MAPAVRVFRQFRASNTHVKAATLTGLAGLVLALAFLMGVLPAIAESDGPDVDPVPVEYGGGSGACDFVGSAAEHELHINNPQTGKFTGPDGTTEIAITVDGNFFDFEVLTPGMGVYDVIVNGGSHNNHFDYDDNGDGPVTEDDGLHAPRKGGPNSPPHNLSHTNICYDELPLGSVSGTKYHDRDADGTEDATEELGLQGWTITAFDSNGNGTDATTDEHGSFTIADLAPGTYTICEQTDTDGLPSNTTGVTWAWTQSQPSDAAAGDCSGFDGYEPFGYTVTINGNDVEDIDFGNHRQVSVTCDPEDDVVVTLDGESDEPVASVTFPGGCESGRNGNDPYTTSFDLGLSTDGDDWRQFVVFGGDPDSTQILTQTIEWAPEPSVYDEETNQLIVDTTRVLLDLTDTSSEPVDVTFCHDIDGGGPTGDTPQCLDSRLITEGGDVPEDHIQLTETYKLLGDPGNFR